MDYFPFVQQDKQLHLGPRMYQKEHFFTDSLVEGQLKGITPKRQTFLFF